MSGLRIVLGSRARIFAREDGCESMGSVDSYSIITLMLENSGFHSGGC